MDKTTRRSMLQLGGWLGISLALPEWELLAAALQSAPAQLAAAKPLQLQPGDLADIDAITAQIIPTDTTPGAREAGVVEFIQRALGSILAPMAQEFRAGLAEFQHGVQARYSAGAAFAALQPAQQTEWLRSVEHSAFFTMIWQLTVLGMFSNPAYGGNRNGIGWQLLGFKDDHAYAPPFGYYDRDYPGFNVHDGEPS
jgi:gluconate 2-dehydrogenase gamma chain